MKNKKLYRLAMMLSCIGLTNLHSTHTFQVEATYAMTDGPLGIKAVDLTKDQAELVRKGGWNDELGQRLSEAFQDAGQLFYVFPTAPIEVTDQAFKIQAVATSSIIYEVKWVHNHRDTLETRIYILEPGIKNSIYIKIDGHRRLSPEVLGKYDSLEQLTEMITCDVSYAWLDERKIYPIYNLNGHMPDLLSMLNFSRTIAAQTNRPVDDIRRFFGILLCGFGTPMSIPRDSEPGYMSITRDSEPGYYSLSLMRGEEQMLGRIYSSYAVLRIRDTGNDGWYKEHYQRPMPMHDSMFELAGSGYKATQIILESIKLGVYTYEFKHRIDLTDWRMSGISGLNWSLGRYLKNNLFNVLDTNTYVFLKNRPDNWFIERYNRINLEEAMWELERADLLRIYHQAEEAPRRRIDV